MIAKLYQPGQQAGEKRGYSRRALCQLFNINRAWYYARQKLAQKSNEQETELKEFVEQLLKD